MSDTRELLAKIAALRQRLEQAHGRAENGGDRVRLLERRLSDGAAHDTLLDASFRQLTAAPLEETPVAPRRLTARARRLLEVGHGLLHQLRALADAFPESDDTRDDPLAHRFRETVAIADTALRAVQGYPDAPSAQLRLCEGLEGTLNVVGERVSELRAAVERRRREAGWVDTLADLLRALAAGQAPDVAPLFALAEALLADAELGMPLRFFAPGAAPQDAAQLADWQARAVACHGVTVAQVMARLGKHDPELRGQPVEAVLAALVHDAGMAAVPTDIYTHVGPLGEAQKRVIEGHTHTGAEWVRRLLPHAAWLADAALSHHERHDGTGYPAGLRETQATPLVRMLAVCDVYAALCVARPYRAALEPRAALTDTLLLAETGVLDRACAERLLHLSFYPVGSVVELADGAIGIVVATHGGRHDLNAPSRPVLALLLDAEGAAVPGRCHLDLAACEGRSIVQAVPAVERRRLLGKHYPELA